MLWEIESALTRRDRWTLQELATSLGVPPALLLAGIEHLVRLGRLPEGSLVRVRPCAENQACGSCTLACGARGATHS